jgi:hypothetical protein
LVAWLVNTVLTEEDKRNLKCIALELVEIRKLVDKLAETLVKISDKDLLKFFNSAQGDFKEYQIDNYEEKLQKQVDIAEKEFRT